MAFRSALVGLLLVVLGGCSSNSLSGPIEFVHTFDRPSETSTWAANGEAIDIGLLCQSATGFLPSFEDENGNVRTLEELEELNQGSVPFVSVSVEQMACNDGSGNFTLRFINQVDPTTAEGIVGVTWAIDGGAEYDDMAGSGSSELPQSRGNIIVWTASGTMTAN